MGNSARIALAALAGAAAVTAGAVAFAGASAAAGPASAPAVQAGQATCVTDGGGYCTVSHGLGVAPEAVLVSANTPSTAYSFMLATVQGSFTATTFQIRAMAGEVTPKAASRIWFSYAAYAGPSAPGTPTSTIIPTTPTPTFTTPTPTTSSTEPTPTFPPFTTTTATGGGS